MLRVHHREAGQRGRHLSTRSSDGADSRDARNNLALAYAAAGNFARARQELEISTDAAAVQYNVGILYMADHQYAKAISAFDAAARLKPHFERAEARARQARALAGPLTEDGPSSTSGNENGDTD